MQRAWVAGGVLLCLILSWSGRGLAAAPSANLDASTSGEPGLLYKNYRDRRGPWSIHVVRVPLVKAPFQVWSVHSDALAVGLSPVSQQLRLIDAAIGTPVAAINGDYYRRDGPFAGDPRGLQIVGGELVSAPSGNASFWIDAIGGPHVELTESVLGVTWPDGATNRVGLNGSRRTAGMELFTAAVGTTTHTSGGRELILERQGTGPWLPLRAGRTYRARVREVRETGNSKVRPDTMVLSIGPALARNSRPHQPGIELIVSTETVPSLRGVKSAISGGPILVQDGKRQRIRSTSDSYQSSSMTERHPRSAIGCNAESLFLVQVDGRYRNVSDGMTLNELGAFLVELGCDQAINLDGGGSATLWFEGKVRNRPCDGYERPVANALVILKNAGAATAETASGSVGSADAPDE